MNRQTSFRIFTITLLAMIFHACSLSQVAVERSKDKVIISGISYYIHLVKKGETSYSISKAYGITPEDLSRENPSVVNGLKEGQSLRIPVKLVPAAPQPQKYPPQQATHDDSRFIYHVLQAGETIYFLSKRYAVTEDEIIKSNPGMDIYKMSTGTEIAIPRKVQVVQRQGTAPQESKAFYHKVVKGETMYSIAKHYGVTVREIRKANRETRFPQVGDYLRIPGMNAVENQPVEKVIPDSVSIVKAPEELYLERPSEFTPVTSLKGTLNAAILLPFYLSENSRNFKIDSTDYNQEYRASDWLFPSSVGFVEMYDGILLAADTLRSLGVDINLHVYDIRSDTFEITSLIRSGKLDRMDLIIGPVHSRNLAILAEYAGKLGIPVVSPVQLYNNSVLANNPTVFMANASLEVAQNSIAGKLRDYSNDSIVLIHSDTSGTDPGLAAFKNKIQLELSSKTPGYQPKFKELVFYSKSLFSNSSVAELSQSLSDKTGNVVVIASEDPPVMSELIQVLHSLSRKYNLTVFGYPDMRQLKNIDPKFFFDLGLMVYSPYWIDYSSHDVKKFCSDFLSKFHTQPSEMSYAWEGYDIAYYFLSGLAIHGKEFIHHPEIHNPHLFYTEYDFRRKSANDGFENQKLFLIRYTNNYQLELVNDPIGFTVK